MLYLDYSRSEGEWTAEPLRRPREPRGVDFLRALNDGRRRGAAGLPSRSPRSRPRGRASRGAVADGGLGFTFKWNMGWMHDTLRYFARDPMHRR